MTTTSSAGFDRSDAYVCLDRSELSDATPQLNVLQRVGGSIGTAVLAAVSQQRAARAAGGREPAG